MNSPMKREAGQGTAGMLVLAALMALGRPTTAFGQHAEHMPGMDMEPTRYQPRLFQSDMSGMAGMAVEPPMDMGNADAWHAMTMGVVRLVYNDQGGPSGDEAFESSNWAMGMLHRSFGPNRLTFMLMCSLEPATIHVHGSPELFQTGESFQGKPLVDRQHAHDFFSNLSVTYRRALGTNAAAWAQAAPVGAPALGPIAFMHRASTGDNPTAPLGHHWQDATHIASTVITIGAGWNRLALEGSAFHGAEPDEDRWDLDGGAIDSYSGRLKVKLGASWSAQVSHGYLHDPEALDPGDVHRTTASLETGADGTRDWAATLVWGQNNEDHGTSNSVLAEAAWQKTRLDQIYGRFEWVEKSEELLATKALPGDPESLADVYALTAGYLRDIDLLKDLTTGLGGDLTVYEFPESLKSVYGDYPLSFHVFLRVRWGDAHGHGHMDTMSH
jgi:hypothetical protein